MTEHPSGRPIRRDAYVRLSIERGTRTRCVVERLNADRRPDLAGGCGFKMEPIEDPWSFAWLRRR